MAVPASYRHPDVQLNAITKAIELESYTIEITKNDKHFPLEYLNSMTSVLVGLSQSILNNLSSANSIRVIYVEDYKLRRKYQLAALGNINSFNVQLMVAKKVFKIKNKRYKYWASLIESVKITTQNWINSDINRYNKKFNLVNLECYNTNSNKPNELPEYVPNIFQPK